MSTPVILALSDWAGGDAGDEAWRIGEPLLRTFASATFVAAPLEIDLDSVIAIAVELNSADP